MITAGSTWVALDRVRVISNVASGQTGFILANKFKKTGARVTLLLGPGNLRPHRLNGVKVVNFKYFAELEKKLKDELVIRKYAAVIHAAAVSDYQPEKVSKNKVSSQLKSWRVNLVPTRKLVDTLKDYDPGLVAVGFKFEPDAGKKSLMVEGNRLLKQADLDLVVSNSNKNQAYQAYILDVVHEYGPFLSKSAMATCLTRLVSMKI